jgi:hypothetical protein
VSTYVTSPRVAVVLLGAALAAFAVPAHTASAGIQPKGTVIDAKVALDASTKTMALTGRIACSDCAGFTLGVTVSQRGSGALAQGGVACRCRGPINSWAVTARVRGKAAFAEGRAMACAWLRIRGGSDKVKDAHQWCRIVRVGLGGGAA